MSTELKILRFDDLMKLYGFNRTELYTLLKTKGCPVLPRGNRAPYRVIQSEFEAWLKSRKV